MKYYLLSIASCLFMVAAMAQPPAKKATIKPAVTTKPGAEKKTAAVLKAPFLSRTFLLNPSLFTGKLDSSSSGSKQVAIKIISIKSAEITISNAAASSVTEFAASMTRSMRQNSVRPDGAGFTYDKIYNSKANLVYNKEDVEFLEYKMVYHGTKSQQELAKAMSKMPKVRDLDAKPGSDKEVNEYDTDANNHIMRIYMLKFTPGVDKGFMMLYYEANIAEDRNLDGVAKLQTIVDGISLLNMQERFDFMPMKDKDFSIDLALPAGSVLDYSSSYSLKGLTGSLKISNVKNAEAGYARLIENPRVGYGTIADSGSIEKHKLYNGLQVFTRTITIENNTDGYKNTWYQVLNIIAPDKKILKKPIQVALTLFSKNMQDVHSINTYILNSISLPGTLTKTALIKTKDTFLE